LVEVGWTPTESHNLGNVIWDIRGNDSVYIIIDTVLCNYSRRPFNTDITVFHLIKSDNQIQIGGFDYRYYLQNQNWYLDNRTANNGHRAQIIKC
jgi:hypothetical protein